jgi:hypothetical protein
LFRGDALAETICDFFLDHFERNYQRSLLPVCHCCRDLSQQDRLPSTWPATNYHNLTVSQSSAKPLVELVDASFVDDCWIRFAFLKSPHGIFRSFDFIFAVSSYGVKFCDVSVNRFLIDHRFSRQSLTEFMSVVCHRVPQQGIAIMISMGRFPWRIRKTDKKLQPDLLID